MEKNLVIPPIPLSKWYPYRKNFWYPHILINFLVIPPYILTSYQKFLIISLQLIIFSVIPLSKKLVMPLYPYILSKILVISWYSHFTVIPLYTYILSKNLIISLQLINFFSDIVTTYEKFFRWYSDHLHPMKKIFSDILTTYQIFKWYTYILSKKFFSDTPIFYRKNFKWYPYTLILLQNFLVILPILYRKNFKWYPYILSKKF